MMMIILVMMPLVERWRSSRSEIYEVEDNLCYVDGDDDDDDDGFGVDDEYDIEDDGGGDCSYDEFDLGHQLNL